MSLESLAGLADEELELARRHLGKLIADTNQAMARCGPGPGWDSLLERLDEAMADYVGETHRRAGAASHAAPAAGLRF
ncbi:hypothetical protein [Brevundimonas bullata]|uniref:Uncharacterized protein n=1 Tax=Brevundimonas bullata TaxID=13160 RepID=A0A7W7IT58_9CAUL|nr:hypothetical protein [Brevundimonas bullata]MBB4799767.1 hypothetical protein [Brevundimonas bullata]MBB6384725.1 hypothetical protein [Brevundimonas bullata]